MQTISKNNIAEILFVSHKHPPSIGGMQKQSYELVKYTSQLAKTHCIVFKNNYSVLFFFFSILPRVLFKLAKHRNISIIHANDALMALFLTPLLISKKVKLCVTAHGLDIVYGLQPFQWWVKNLLSKFDLIIAVSDATKVECINRGISKEKVVFIPNAYDLPKSTYTDPNFREWLKSNYGVDENQFTLVSVGRAVPRKGFLWFVKEVLPNINQPVVYLIVGPALKKAKTLHSFKRILPKWFFKMYCQLNGITLDYVALKEITEKSQGEINFQLMGKISDEKLDQLYLHANLFLMPNLKVKGDFEGFGLVALEAASRKTVCLVADVDGIPSAIENNQTGILLPSNEPLLWANKINCLLSDSDELKASGLRFSENLNKNSYTWLEMSQRYLNEFNKLIAK